MGPRLLICFGPDKHTKGADGVHSFRSTLTSKLSPHKFVQYLSRTLFLRHARYDLPPCFRYDGHPNKLLDVIRLCANIILAFLDVTLCFA